MKRTIRYILSLLLLMCLGVGETWGQTNYSGTYYLRNTQTNNQNYYLVPAVGGYYNNNEATPYLTTFKTEQDMNSMWRLVKVNVDGTDYYRIIHNSTGLYVTANDAVSGYEARHLRMHLEASDTPTDATLFVITGPNANGRRAIRPKDAYDATNNRYWWDINGGNQPNYWNNNATGALGFWEALANPQYNWILESAPSTCAMPIISYNSTDLTFSISYPISEDGASIYYTTDGTEPTATNGTLYKGAFSETGVKMVRAIAVREGWENSEEALLYAPKYPILFKTTDDANFSYYMIQPTDDSKTTDPYVTTSNVPNPRMGWLMESAGLYGGVQYYRFKNYDTGKYIYCNVNENNGNALLMKGLDESGTTPDRFIFRLLDRGGYLNIIPKPFVRNIPSSSNKNCFRKANNTDHNNPIGINQDDGGLSRWLAIAAPDDPRTLSALPEAMVTEGTNAVAFKIRNATQSNGNDYFVCPPTTPTGSATASATGDNLEWYFLPATDDDTWGTYYYLRNVAGDYLYFDGTTYNNNDNKFYVNSTVTAGNEDKFKFMVLRTANTTYSGTWHIVPKQIRHNNNQTQIALNRNNATLRTQGSRANNSSCWYLDEQSGFVAKPIITYDPASNTISITCMTPGTTIHYTTDGTDATTSSSEYSNPFTPAAGVTTIKAIAIREGSTSVVTTYTLVFQTTVGNDESNQRPYLIQNCNNSWDGNPVFYMIPDSPNGNANTTSLPMPRMEWYFKYAGRESNYDYYNIVNKVTGEYLYYDATKESGKQIVLNSSYSSSDNGFKFRFVQYGTHYNIVPYGSTSYVHKGNGNNREHAVTLNAGQGGSSEWFFVTKDELDTTVPFTPSDNSSTTFYKLQNADNDALYITPPTTGSNVYMSNTSDYSVDWYFEKAEDAAGDEWNTYYYIRHGLTGEYLYYNGGETHNNSQCFELRTNVDAAQKSRYMYTWAKSSTLNQYYIVPHFIRNETLNYTSTLRRDQAQLKANTARGAGSNAWTFVVADDMPLQQPIIRYNADYSKYYIFTTTGGATIYYTTDGSAPTASSTEYTAGQTGIDVPEGVTVIKAIAKKGSSTTEVTSFVACRVSTADNKKPYLIQSVENEWYYITTSENDNSYERLTTTSLYRPSMMWCFEDAGWENGKQYYYLYNKEEQKYVRYRVVNDADNITLDTKANFDAANATNKEGFKFCIDYRQATGDFNIMPKSKQTVFLYKNNGNKTNYLIGLVDWAGGNVFSRWKFIPVFNEKMPESLMQTVEQQNYKIGNEGAPTYFITVPTGGADKIITAEDATDSNNAWFLQKAGSDDWLTYYNIINSQTGQYLCYQDDNNIVLRESGTGENCQFALAKSTTSVGEGTDAKPAYFIVPKPVRYNYKNNFYSLWRDSEATNLKAKATRYYGGTTTNEDNVIKWYFTPTTSQFPAPVVHFDNTSSQVSFSAPIDGATYYYTTDGSTNPAESETNKYTGPFTISEQTTIRVIAAKSGFTTSEVVEQTIGKVATPIHSTNSKGKIILTSDTPGAVIYYAVGDTPDNIADPTTSSTPYVGPMDDVSGKFIKAIAVKPGMITSDVYTSSSAITLQCAAPIIKRGSGKTFRMSCVFPASGVTIYYTTNSSIDLSDSPTSGTQYTPGAEISFTGTEVQVWAIAVADGYANSAVAHKTIYEELQGDGTETVPYEIASTGDYDEFVKKVNGDDGGAAAYYRVTDDFSASESNAITVAFTGVLEGVAKEDGTFPIISDLTHALFNSVNGGKVRNIILDNINISSGTNVGAIANEAIGDTRIYNCGILSGSVGGTGYVGSIVGLLNGTSRVINCYSFANVNGGTDVGGIVGYNNVANSNANNVTTMVMNCMFYGNATGTNISPIYGGNIINNNSNTGLNNFNYYSFKDFTSTVTEGKYNCALGAEERFLTQFEFYRQILNSNRELATWYVNGSTADSRDVIAKWVLDKNVKPYPILKSHGKYTSIINYDASAGKSLGILSVSIEQGNNAPAGASITTSSLVPIRTDKDPENYNFNYDKVQLPYYNDVGTGNYTGNKVVVGWEITSISGGTSGNFKAEDSAEGYNFADRDCTQKDLFSVTGRVFSQGAYFDVPTGVIAITIKPHWATAAYLSDPNYDKTYSKDYGNNTYNITSMGTRYNNDTKYVIKGSSQKVYTTMGNAITALNREDNSSVYDYAVVLVGNYHHYYGNSQIANDTKGFTIMSADLDGDNEPDNCFFYQHQQRQAVSPIRFDFLCWSGIGMAQKPSNSPRMPDIGIFKPRGWFEVTNTCLAHFYQFEYDWGTKNADKDGSPLILLGGIYEQIVSSNDGAPTHTKYIHLGSNAWFKMFNNGIHADKDFFTPHKPISVTGGDYDLFYLSGMFRPDATANADNAECYISGGRFGEVAGAGMEKINGNVYWQIDHADIEAFYGGGINAAQPVQGDITTDITNSNVTTFCGGPKFGDMVTGKKVTTTASGCTFGQYFGAGYGGTSLNRIRKYNLTNSPNYNFNSSWVSSYSRAYETSTKTTPDGTGGPTNDITVNAIATNYEYELFPFSGFANDNNVGRFYVNYASLSLATTRNVTSTLTGCKITGNFYGGGSLGKVEGDVTSTLTDCEVKGNVFGAGFSAAAPTVEVMAKTGFTTEPHYDGNSGFYIQGVYPASVTYTWHQAESVSAGNEFDETNKYIYTTVNFPEEGGTVTGDVTLNIRGTTTVSGDVYGGGALASSNTGTNKKTTINLLGGTITGNVYGGGMGQLAADAVGAPGTAGYIPAKEGVEAKVGSTQVNLNGMGATEYQDAYSSWGLVTEGEGKPYTVANTAKGCVVGGSIFGCNNINGTPLGDATVHVYKTQNAGATQIGNTETMTTAKQNGAYDLTAVYGGGNLAPFVPTADNASTHVIIDGCDLTSIETVYGGGNAASTPATDVTVNGTFEIKELFGGGNGLNALPDGKPNPGANVGYKNYTEYVEDGGTLVARDKEEANTKEKRLASDYVYGTGAANVTIYGGTIHQVFGGSNTKGNVRISAVTLLDDNNDCDFKIDEAYGGGKSAPMDAEAKLLMSCIPGLKAAYGGAEAANIEGNVTLNITNGNFDRVFGGNNKSGRIGGTITVNIEETGCKPVIIGQLYGGGNQAPYTAPFVKDDGGNDTEVRQHGPTLNIRSFTSIGEVYGGGYGEGAVVTGDTYVNINEVVGDKSSQDEFMKETVASVTDPATQTTGTDKVSKNTGVTKTFKDGDGDDANTISVDIPLHKKGEIGSIGVVFGGGNAAKVDGNTHVNIGTVSSVDYQTKATGETTARTGLTTVGADIRGNVYGGGNQAEVTGDTHVQIGKKVEP